MLLNTGSVLELEYNKPGVPDIIRPWSQEDTTVPELLITYRMWAADADDTSELNSESDGFLDDVQATGKFVATNALRAIARHEDVRLPRSAGGGD
jgi:hypothetical protein